MQTQELHQSLSVPGTVAPAATETPALVHITWPLAGGVVGHGGQDSGQPLASVFGAG
jgi:hypothetical protein